MLSQSILALAAVSAVFAAPQVVKRQDAHDGTDTETVLSVAPVPGMSNYYDDYALKAAPYPGNISAAIMNTTSGEPGKDDLLFQNLLAAEWAIFSFYQQGVELFNTSSFTALGLPNNTYDRIVEIRDNEAGHLAIFQSQITSNSIKPGQCQYAFGATTPQRFLLTLTLLEVASMAFLTGLVQQAQLDFTKGALTAIAETESRHNTWVLIDIWNVDPFAGPADTSFPYANQILDSTNSFIIPNSCPTENPIYPYPRQGLPQFTYNPKYNSSLNSGQPIEFVWESAPPAWKDGACYYAVFYHELNVVSMPFDIETNLTTIPDFDLNKGLIVGVIADTPNAPTLESVVAGPVLLVQQPAGAIKLASTSTSTS